MYKIHRWCIYYHILPIWLAWWVYRPYIDFHTIKPTPNSTRCAGAHGGDAVAWGSQRAPRTRAHGERFGWFVLSWVFWFGRQKRLTPNWMPHIATKELVWFFQEVLNLRKIACKIAVAGFPSSKLVFFSFSMMNDGPFSPKVSGLCSCAPIFADARHRGWSAIDGRVQKKSGLKQGGFVFFFCVKMIQFVFSWVEIGRVLIVTLIPMQYTYDVSKSSRP